MRKHKMKPASICAHNIEVMSLIDIMNPADGIFPTVAAAARKKRQNGHDRGALLSKNSS
jgi:hypothetical protein